jgi:hypothetical protein
MVGRREVALNTAHATRPPRVTSRANVSASARSARSSMDIGIVVRRERRLLGRWLVARPVPGVQGTRSAA